MVVARPDGYQADAVARMLIERMGQLPAQPRREIFSSARRVSAAAPSIRAVRRALASAASHNLLD